MTPHCQYHCAACGLCFASLDAFDHHRTGSFRKGTRRCQRPERARRRDGTPRLEVVERGLCDSVEGREVEIWGTPR